MNEQGFGDIFEKITETVTHIIFNIDLVNIPVVFRSKTTIGCLTYAIQMLLINILLYKQKVINRSLNSKIVYKMKKLLEN